MRGLLSLDLGIGEIIPLVHDDGNILNLKHLLNRIVKNSIDLRFFTASDIIPSMPGALPFLQLASTYPTSFLVIGTFSS